MLSPELFGALTVGLIALATFSAYRAGKARGVRDGYDHGASLGYARGRQDERKESEAGQ
jgi:hypothetical protein